MLYNVSFIALNLVNFDYYMRMYSTITSFYLLNNCSSLFITIYHYLKYFNNQINLQHNI